MQDATYGNAGATSPAKQKFISNAAAQAYKGPSIVDYLSLAGKPTDMTSRGTLATEYGISGYRGSADQNTALLAALRASGSATPGSDPASGGTPPPQQQQPDVPLAAPEDPYRTAFDSYLKSLEMPPEAKAATDYLNSLITQSKQANEKALNSGETLGFASGEAGRVNRDNALMLDAAARNVEAQTGVANSRTAIAKARADFEANILGMKEKQNAPFELSPGQERYTYDPKTGKYVKTAAADAKSTLPASAQEYEYAKAQGYKGTYQQYQTEDANRKFRAAGGSPTSNDRANTAQDRDNDIATVIIDFKDKMTKNKWKGANPEAYNYYRQQLIDTYGAAAALELDKQMKEARISVDYGK